MMYDRNLFRDIRNNADYNTLEQPVCTRKSLRSFELLFLAAIDTYCSQGQNRHDVKPRLLQRKGELHPSIRDIWLRNVVKEPSSRGSEFQLRQ